MSVSHRWNRHDDDFFEKEDQEEAETREQLSDWVIEGHAVHVAQSFNVFLELREQVEEACAEEDAWRREKE